MPGTQGQKGSTNSKFYDKKEKVEYCSKATCHIGFYAFYEKGESFVYKWVHSTRDKPRALRYYYANIEMVIHRLCSPPLEHNGWTNDHRQKKKCN